MKKTIIISALALCFSVVTLHAETSIKTLTNYQPTSKVKVSPFCVSIAKGDFETVKKLVELGTDVNQKSEGMTPVMYAAKYNRTDILKLLIANGANLKAKSDKGMTAIKYAELHKAHDAKAILEEAMKK
ncbi:ankyrin repeat domain-containing protein [Confluentibacter flavum]|uniref:Ankyrin repeat domain-containing protein n=1 Tax=Confluentibacter flavum TaxID=1909700 RepID=A0A2N3HG03_9FLAO|nr:ankyrin repeat domain-containing protein [Confluentibacter flavum]PKQ43919.1 ankyrin repeat domain-containing protein [Confluentibacter flavum]